MSVQPYSACRSNLPVDLRLVQVRVFGSSTATRLSNLPPKRNRPSGKTADGESPMKPQPLGGSCIVHILQGVIHCAHVGECEIKEAVFATFNNQTAVRQYRGREIKRH